MTTALRPLSTGELLDRTFSLYRSHFLVFLGIVALPHLCVLAVQCLALALQGPGTSKSSVSQVFVWGFGAALLSIAVSAASHAATVVAVSQVHLDRPAGVMDLDQSVRVNTAVQIADRIKAKTGLQPEPHQHVDDFLEEAARKIRDSGQFR